MVVLDSSLGIIRGTIFVCIKKTCSPLFDIFQAVLQNTKMTEQIENFYRIFIVFVLKK